MTETKFIACDHTDWSTAAAATCLRCDVGGLIRKRRAPTALLLVKTPTWAYIFMAACILIPFVSLGGTIPGGLAGGGAATCQVIAKSSSLSPPRRVALCCGTTLLCWVVFAMLVTWLFGR